MHRKERLSLHFQQPSVPHQSLIFLFYCPIVTLFCSCHTSSHSSPTSCSHQLTSSSSIPLSKLLSMQSSEQTTTTTPDEATDSSDQCSARGDSSSNGQSGVPQQKGFHYSRVSYQRSNCKHESCLSSCRRNWSEFPNCQLQT